MHQKPSVGRIHCPGRWKLTVPPDSPVGFLEGTPWTREGQEGVGEIGREGRGRERTGRREGKETYLHTGSFFSTFSPNYSSC